MAAQYRAPSKNRRNKMDILNIFFAANVALCAVTLVGAALTKSGVIDGLRGALSSANYAGIAGAAFGLLTVSSAGAMFL
jgi:hypothetical protein